MTDDWLNGCAWWWRPELPAMIWRIAPWDESSGGLEIPTEPPGPGMRSHP